MSYRLLSFLLTISLTTAAMESPQDWSNYEEEKNLSPLPPEIWLHTIQLMFESSDNQLVISLCTLAQANPMLNELVRSHCPPITDTKLPEGLPLQAEIQSLLDQTPLNLHAAKQLLCRLAKQGDNRSLYLCLGLNRLKNESLESLYNVPLLQEIVLHSEDQLDRSQQHVIWFIAKNSPKPLNQWCQEVANSTVYKELETEEVMAIFHQPFDASGKLSDTHNKQVIFKNGSFIVENPAMKEIILALLAPSKEREEITPSSSFSDMIGSPKPKRAKPNESE